MSHYDDIYLHDTAREEAEAEQERIDARLAELLADRDAVLEADSWIAGTLDYDGLETAAADLSAKVRRGDPIEGSDALARILRLGEDVEKARLAKLAERAEQDVAEAAAFRPDMEDAA